MTQNIVKNQHYIPSSLLEHFTNQQGKFFEVLLREKRIYPTNPEDSMSARFTYEDENLKVNTVENYFGKIETAVVPLIKELITTIQEHKKGNVEFTVVQKAVENLLPTFIVFYYRSGALLTEFTSIDKKDKIPLLSKKILNERYINALTKTILDSYKFAIIESNGDFLMSDQYVSTAALKIKSQFANISNRHIGVKETLILIPISSNFYAVFWHSENRFSLAENSINYLSDDEIDLINQTIINNSYIKCIGAKKENLEKGLNDYQLEFPSQVYIGHHSGASSGYIRKKEVFYDDIDKKAYDILSHGLQIQKYMSAERNDPCPCKSGKKFKRCHDEIIDRIKIPIENLKNQAHIKSDIYRIPNALVVELPIDEWGPYSR